MTQQILFYSILVPFIGGILALLFSRKWALVSGIVAIVATAITLIMALSYFGQEATFSGTWAGSFGLDFLLRLTRFNSFIALAISGFGFLIAVYSWKFLSGHRAAGQFFGYLLFTVSFALGAVLSDHMVLFLFFWEGLLVLLFAMIFIGHPGAYKSATKAFIINGLADLCLMAGAILTIKLSDTMIISAIHLPLNSLGSVAFILLMIGAIAKGGSMPFHSWIPDAATDAPLPFMAFLPGALEKLLGIYFLTRISLDMFLLDHTSWISTVMMIIGAITILLAVLMALVQKNYKRLLAYHAISQVGYMVLGIGTMVPAGVIGGIFHMINNAIYKCGLFLTGGALEKQAGTADLESLGGMGKKMPITFAVFIITALSISGVPPFNGFFSKELVYDGALEHGMIFYLAAVIGSFFTAASFLKLGHAAFLGKSTHKNISSVKEAPLSMLVPMLILAGLCIFFGLYNTYPIDQLVMPALGSKAAETAAGHHLSGFPASLTLVLVSVVVLTLAVINHLIGVKVTGRGLGAVDHIHYAPGAHQLYNQAEKGNFDPYFWFTGLIKLISRLAWIVDRGVDLIYDVITVKITTFLSGCLRRAHTGSHTMYLAWTVIGLIIVIIYMMRGV